MGASYRNPLASGDRSGRVLRIHRLGKGKSIGMNWNQGVSLGGSDPQAWGTESIRINRNRGMALGGHSGSIAWGGVGTYRKQLESGRL